MGRFTGPRTKSVQSRLSEQQREALLGALARRKSPIETAPVPAERSTAECKFASDDRPDAGGPRALLSKLALVVSYLLLSNRTFIWFIGAMIKIDTVFLAYPSSNEILSGYAYPGLRAFGAWRPTLIGVFRHTCSWGLTFAVTSTELDLADPINADRLTKLYNRMQGVLRTVGGTEVRFAGVIPGILFSRGTAVSHAEASSAVAAIMKAEAAVRLVEQLDRSTPVIILGADGFVGQRLVAQMADRNVYCVDIGPGGAAAPNIVSWPHHLHGRKALLIDVARPGTIELYEELLWRSLVIINEVYPAPPPRVLRKLINLNCHCYHIAGAKGDAYPPFPSHYAGAIPCCASKVDEETELVVTRIT